MLGLRSRLALALVATLASSGCHAVQTSQDYYGIDTTGQSVLFVIDISGSMEGKQEGTIQDQVQAEAANRGGSEVQRRVGGTVGRILGRRVRSEANKLGAAKRELIPAIRGLDESTTFNIIAFGDNIRVWKNSLIPATSGNRNTGAIYVDRLTADGGTPMRAALDRAFQFRPQTIFLLTDGQPTDASAQAILDQVRGLNSGRTTTVHTVGLGPDQDAQFLADLAEQNGGRFVERR
ncbi:MAG: hypothetical protein Rubg2KO_23600 [Rubricoccaceae bacterium]